MVLFDGQMALFLPSADRGYGVRRLIVAIAVGLISELYPIFGGLFLLIFFLHSDFGSQNLMFVYYVSYLVNFAIVAGAAYWLYGAIAKWKQRRRTSSN